MLEQRRGRQVQPERARRSPTHGANNPIDANNSNVAISPNVDRIIKARQIIRIKRRNNDAAEGPIFHLNSARQLNRPFSGRSSDDRLADEQFIVCGTYEVSKMLAIPEV